MKILKKINDFLFPLNCLGCGVKDTFLCDSCFRKLTRLEDFCPFCLMPSLYGATCRHCQKKHSLDGAFVALNYSQPLVKKLIKKTKYQPYLFPLLSNVTEALTEKIKKSNFLKNPGKFILLPIPLTSKKNAQRGYNQTEIIAEKLKNDLGLLLDLKTLKKQKETRAQSQLNLRERRKNVNDCFKITREVKGKNFILVDDLITSGSTLDEAAKVLKMKGAYKVWAFVLGRNLESK